MVGGVKSAIPDFCLLFCYPFFVPSLADLWVNQVFSNPVSSLCGLLSLASLLSHVPGPVALGAGMCPVFIGVAPELLSHLSVCDAAASQQDCPCASLPSLLPWSHASPLRMSCALRPFVVVFTLHSLFSRVKKCWGGGERLPHTPERQPSSLPRSGPGLHRVSLSFRPMNFSVSCRESLQVTQAPSSHPSETVSISRLFSRVFCCV